MLEIQGRIVAMATDRPATSLRRSGAVRRRPGHEVLEGQHAHRPPVSARSMSATPTSTQASPICTRTSVSPRLPLWHEPTRTVGPWLHRDLWPSAKSYKPDVSWPAYAYLKGAPEELLAYAQVRALAGGTTTIQGWPNANGTAGQPAGAQRRRRRRPRLGPHLGDQPLGGRARRPARPARRRPDARVPPVRRPARQQCGTRVRRCRHGRMPAPPADRHPLLRGRRRRVQAVERARRPVRPRTRRAALCGRRSPTCGSTTRPPT